MYTNNKLRFQITQAGLMGFGLDVVAPTATFDLQGTRPHAPTHPGILMGSNGNANYGIDLTSTRGEIRFGSLSINNIYEEGASIVYIRGNDQLSIDPGIALDLRNGLSINSDKSNASMEFVLEDENGQPIKQGSIELSRGLVGNQTIASMEIYPGDELDVKAAMSITGGVKPNAPAENGIYLGKDNLQNYGIELQGNYPYIDFTDEPLDYKARIIFNPDTKSLDFYGTGGNFEKVSMASGLEVSGAPGRATQVIIRNSDEEVKFAPGKNYESQFNLFVTKGVWSEDFVMSSTDRLKQPDYVFAEDYQLNSLATLESYINTHKHLPDVPSESEIEEKGYLSLLDQTTGTLKNLEEQVLHNIAQEKKIQAQAQENAELRKQLTAQDERIKRLEALILKK